MVSGLGLQVQLGLGLRLRLRLRVVLGLVLQIGIWLALEIGNGAIVAEVCLIDLMYHPSDAKQAVLAKGPLSIYFENRISEDPVLL